MVEVLLPVERRPPVELRLLRRKKKRRRKKKLRRSLTRIWASVYSTRVTFGGNNFMIRCQGIASTMSVVGVRMDGFGRNYLKRYCLIYHQGS